MTTRFPVITPDEDGTFGEEQYFKFLQDSAEHLSNALDFLLYWRELKEQGLDVQLTDFRAENPLHTQALEALSNLYDNPSDEE